MASTYSPLKIELITTGEQSGTWGTTTNTNLGTALEEAIVGSADVTFASGTVTLTLTDTNATQTARNLRLNLTGTSGGAQNLIVPAIEKLYLVNNGCADAITVKNSSGTGVAVPAGKTMFVYNTGSNVVDATTHLSSLTLGSALPAASGGTGITSLGAGVATFLSTPSSSNLAAAVTDETGSGSLVFATSPTLVTPLLGTPTSGNLANCTFPTLNQNTTGSAATFTSTSQNSQFNSVGVGTAASTTAGEIRATNNVTAYYTSDIKFKENVKDIPNALDKVNAIGGKLFDWTDSYIQERGGEDGYFIQKSDFGVIAQDVQAVFPEAVRVKPDQTLAVDYEKLSALAFAAIRELSEKVKTLEGK